MHWMPRFVTFDYTSLPLPKLHGYRIAVHSKLSDHAPTTWSLQGSADGIQWVPLDSISGFSDWPGDHKEGRRYPNFARTFWFSNDTTYRYYRLNFDDGDEGAVSEINLYEDSIFGHAAMTQSHQTY